MPETENQDTQSSETSLSAEETLLPAETALERFERERLSRRQALKKLGVTTAMATFAMFSVDDLAHMVGQAMQQQAGDNKIANQIAKEFQKSGIVFAGAGPSGCNLGTDPLSLCECDCNKKYTKCVGTAPIGCNPAGGSIWPQCWAYNANIAVCRTVHTNCTLNCQTLA